MIDFNLPPEPEISMTPRWMISFADLLSLILTFFVLLFSMAVPPIEHDPQDNTLVGNTPNQYSLQKDSQQAIITVARTDQGLSTDYLYDIIKDQTTIYPALAKLKLRSGRDSLILSIDAKDFDVPMAEGIAHLLNKMNNKMSLYTSRLDVSEAVARKLLEMGMEKNLSFFESASTRNRIDIIIYP